MQLIESLRTRQHLAEIESLTSNRCRAMEQLCEALALGHGLGPVANLAADQKAELADEAIFMCELWERDARVKDELARRNSTIHRLLSEQAAISRLIVGAEAQMVSSLSDA